MEKALAPNDGSDLRRELMRLVAAEGTNAEFSEAVAGLLAEHPAVLKRSLNKIKHRHVVRDVVGHPGRLLPILPRQPAVEERFKECGYAAASLQWLIKNYEFSSVLDVGSGAGKHARLLASFGKSVTKLDFGVSYYFKQETDNTTAIIGDVNMIEFPEKYDCVWASHVLEHQRNVGIFLEKLRSLLKPDGILCITVPPAKFELVGGHLTLWTPGHLIYNLVLAGFDCSDAEIFHYDYNISVFVRNRAIKLPKIHYDTGDIRRLQKFLPDGFSEAMDASLAITKIIG